MLNTCLILATTLCALGDHPTATDARAALCAAALAGEWNQVLELAIPECTETPSVAGLIRAHACLATNRSNEALCEFQRWASVGDRAEWLAFATALSSEHPDSAVALYLYGDALARAGMTDAALAALDGSIALQSSVLALNARGALHCVSAEWNEAIIDLTRAVALDGAFADAQASLGTCWILLSEAPEMAERCFENALALVPDSVIALNGRGCARLVLARLDESRADLLAAASGCLPAVETNYQTLLLAQLEFLEHRTQLLADAGSEAGMSLMREIKNTSRQLESARSATFRSAFAGAVSDTLSRAIGSVHVGITGGRQGPTPSLDVELHPSAIIDDYHQMFSAHTQQSADLVVGLQDRLSGMQSRLQHPNLGGDAGGCDSLPIETALVDTGHWQVTSVFGLGYSVVDSNPVEAEGPTDVATSTAPGPMPPSADGK